MVEADLAKVKVETVRCCCNLQTTKGGIKLNAIPKRQF